MATLAELYVRLAPYEASEGEYERLGEYINEMAIGAALTNYGGGVTVEVVITAGSAKINVRVLQVLVALDLVYGHMADWKGFKEQVASTYEASASFLNTVSEAVPKIAHATPNQIKRVEKRYKASGKLKELVDRVDELRSVKHGLGKLPLLREIQQLAIEAEKDLTAEERTKLVAGLTEAVAEVDEELPLVSAGMTKVALPPRPPRLSSPEAVDLFKKPPKTKRRKMRVVFQRSTDLPTKRRSPR
jgi:hypothetical protein